jgi:hypothetical protein
MLILKEENPDKYSFVERMIAKQDEVFLSNESNKSNKSNKSKSSNKKNKK